MIFDIYGPYKIDRKSRILFDDKDAEKAFWSKAYPGLSEACGCYIFAKKAGKGIMPWYVGMTTRSFKKECFDHSKRNKYIDTLQKEKGTPLLFLIPKITKTGRFVKSSRRKHKDISFLENLLIGACLERNEELLNKKQTKMLGKMKVPGLLNSSQGKPKTDVSAFSKMLGK